MNAEEVINRVVNRNPQPARLILTTKAERICPHCSGAGRDMDRKGAPICEVCKGWGAIPRLNIETAMAV